MAWEHLQSDIILEFFEASNVETIRALNGSTKNKGLTLVSQYYEGMLKPRTKKAQTEEQKHRRFIVNLNYRNKIGKEELARRAREKYHAKLKAGASCRGKT